MTIDREHARIGVLMGGRSGEREVSLRTGTAILEALKRLGYRAEAVVVDADFLSRLPTLEIDIAYIALHGTFGEDGRIQALLEWQGVPYTSSGVAVSALCARKDLLKRFLSAYDIPMARDRLLERGDSLPSEAELSAWVREGKWRYPLMVKPASEGSSLGISRVMKEEDLLPALKTAADLDRQVLVEEYIAGRELTVGVLNGEVLPILEIIPDGEFYDYRAKYQSKATQYLFPDNLSGAVVESLRAYSEQIWRALGARGAIRIDWILGKGEVPHFLEVNTIPGMTATSLLPKAAAKVGMSFDVLVERILLGGVG